MNMTSTCEILNYLFMLIHLLHNSGNYLFIHLLYISGHLLFKLIHLFYNRSYYVYSKSQG